MNPPIPYGRQSITEEDIQAVVSTLRSDYLTQGPKIAEFEEAFARYIGCKYAVAVSNGTAALHLAAIALKVSPGHKVITTPITFAASANCIRYCGGEVDFCDIDPETYLIDINAVFAKLQSAPRGTYKGIVPVDFAGRAVDLQVLRKVADEFGCWILEDSCHAPGGFFRDSNDREHRCGSGEFAELAIFSFHPVKHIAAGEGGMVTTNDQALYHELLALRTHGMIRDQEAFVNTPEMAALAPTQSYPGWYMEMQMLGYNYRLTDFQAALGISQLARADVGLARRRLLAERYQSSFKGRPFMKGQSGAVAGHAYHLYIIEVEDRLGLYNHLRKNGIFAQIHYIPAHLMPYYQEFGWKKGDFPHAETYYSRCISLPMYPGLSDKEHQFVVQTVIGFYD